MAAITWNSVGERFFEAGIDRGVLYPPTGPGVPWVGLTEVSENASGGEPTPYYLDGVKYANVASSESFNATLSAFYSPPEFDVCDGVVDIQNGLLITQQARAPFGLSYRTKVGNDTDGTDHGYKLHIVYNALSSPAERTHETLSDSTDPAQLSWAISTLPPVLSGYKPTAHFVIDTRRSTTLLISAIEEILYGGLSTTARQPTPQELVNLFTA